MVNAGRRGERPAGRVFIVATLVDFVYQLVVGDRIDPSQSLLVATTLALVPYLLLCGPLNRVARWRGRHGMHGKRSLDA